jgi:hypothetical protein
VRGPLGIAVAVLAVASWSACGGGGGGTSSSGSGTPSGGGGTTNPGGAVVTPTVVSVASGQTTQGVDILVPGTASAINADALGVASLSAGGGTAFNTGATVARGSSVRVLVFGKGLSGTDQISISGPNDITVSSPQTIKSTDDTPGVAFTIAVSATADTGARTVILRDANDNIATFTGGLEVR